MVFFQGLIDVIEIFLTEAVGKKADLVKLQMETLIQHQFSLWTNYQSNSFTSSSNYIIRRVSSGLESIQYYDRNTHPLDTTVTWCVSLSYEIMTELLFFCACFCPLHQSEHSFRFFPHVVHVKVRDGPALELMLKGVCVCFCVNGGQVLRTTDLGGERLFYGHFMLREGLFMAAGYCFLQVWVLLLERSIKRAESGRGGAIIPVFAVWASEGIICPEFIAKGGTRWNHVECSVPVTWETDYTNRNTGT